MSLLPEAHRPAPPRRDGLIVFDQVGTIYSVTPDGGGLTSLRAGQTPALSPDGHEIAYGDLSSDDVRLAVMNSDGSNARLVLPDETGVSCYPRPSWSPDGTQIAFSAWVEGADAWQIFVVNADGSGRRLLVSGPGSVAPAWSPDGEWIAFGGIGLMRPDGSDIHPLPLHISASLDWPLWSPDGEWLAFTVNATNIGKVRRDGTGFEQLTATWGSDIPGTFSPDGSQILFSRQFHLESPSLYLMNNDGTDLHRFLPEMNGTDASWAGPSARAFSSPRPGVPRIPDEYVNLPRPAPPAAQD